MYGLTAPPFFIWPDTVSQVSLVIRCIASTSDSGLFARTQHGLLKVLSGRRPEIASTEMPEEIRKLIELCWSEDPRERPAADKMAFILTRLWNANKEQVERQRAVAEAAASLLKLRISAIGTSRHFNQDLSLR